MTTLNKFKNTHVAKMIKELFETGAVRPVIAYGSGRRTSYKDYTHEILQYVNKESVVIGNDAPRGGATGNFIKLKF